MSLLQYTKHIVLASTFLTSMAHAHTPETKAPQAAPATPQIKKTNSSLTVKVQKMTCQGCANKVESTLKDKPGVLSVKANYQTGTVSFEYDSEKTNPDTLKQYLTDMGKPVIS